MNLKQVKALTFDVFGTVVDWRHSIIREGEQIGRQKGLTVDWEEFANKWRNGYVSLVGEVKNGERAWTTVDSLNRLSLNKLLREYQINDQFTENEKDNFNRVWHRLLPWPDAIPGLTWLRKRYILATLSNGNISLLVNMAKYSALPWDCIFSAELVKAYKDDAHVYQMAIHLLGLQSYEVMMVAAHTYDLDAAKRQGMQTAFIWRSQEELQRPHKSKYDIVCDDFLALAQKLDA
ncbi:haloacid dehalogenase [Reticulibacter mediterranei]|uniref:Haloacid dehalogenase n=1 Tax=Reticulibacter mediterranei TaxID=2778369 RepID=A0A8J3N5Q4_9CHLR|nr:haloacid dehalogenase type II [Reticulibacter mediterranei]GHO95387.1 haloacid dehalogenase [Reticulibacter mediterranei]